MYEKNSVNKAIIVGNIADDKKTSYTKSNVQVTNFTVATNAVNKEGEQTAEFHKIVAFGKASEIADNYYQKGDQVYVEGRLQTNKWEDENGNKKQQTQIVAIQLQKLGNKGSSAGSDNQGKSSESQEGGESSLPF